MPWNYEHNPSLRIIEVRYSGVVSAQELQESTTELIKLQKASGVNRLLVDATEISLAASLADLYGLPAEQYPEEGADRASRLALILPSAAKERKAAQFYETACRNRGWNVKAFSGQREAIEWLVPDAASKGSERGDSR